MKLAVDDDELAACVSCGLCLPHCPTYRVTGEESASPRGRIAAMRAVHAGAEPDDAFVGFMDECVQCRACETACPSSVPFGRLMEGTRTTLVGEGRYQPTWKRLAYAVLPRQRLLRVLSVVGAIAQRAGLAPRTLPRIGLRRAPLRVSRPANGEAVWLLTGCVGDAWLRPVHQATIDVLEAASATVRLPGPGAGCCGALHAHAGLIGGARSLAERVVAAFPGEDPILVNSAGCGAHMKAYGHLLGTRAAETFSARVLDVHEWLAPRIVRVARAPGNRERVVVQDPCHLRNVQRAHASVRDVLAPFCEMVELDDEGLCCGAGGAYAAQQPELADAIRERKLASIARTGASLVASANPGCMLHLRAVGVDARHPMELVAAALGSSALRASAHRSS